MKLENPKDCGIGQGADCCIFVVVGPNGFECERDGPLAASIIARRHLMSAQRMPTEPYPHCQIERKQDGD